MNTSKEGIVTTERPATPVSMVSSSSERSPTQSARSPQAVKGGLSISIASESERLPLLSPGAPGYSLTESSRAAALRAKGASLVQQVMTNRERLGSSDQDSHIAARILEELPVFEPIDDPIGESLLLDTSEGRPTAPSIDLNSGLPEVAGLPEVTAFKNEAQVEPVVQAVGDSALEALSVVEVNLSGLLIAELPGDAPVSDLREEPAVAFASPTDASAEAVVETPTRSIGDRSSVPAEPFALRDSIADSVVAVEAVASELRGASDAEDPIFDMDGLYVAMTGGRNRWDATSRMVEWIAKTLPGTNVRCGLGNKRLRRFVDARLGWLGSESSLQRAMAGQWRIQLTDSAGSVFQDEGFTIRLARPGTSEVALLSIDGDRASRPLFEVFQKHETALSAILWGRPRWVLPEWSATKGRPRVAIIAAGIMLLLLFVCPVPYPAACSVLVEPMDSRVVSAPFEAMLESVAVEPGDEVTKGQSLAELDGRPLRLEQQSIDAEIQQATKQQDVAIAAGRIAEAQLAQLKCQQLRRQRELLERRLNQLKISSPIEGVIVAGDLRRSIGIPLESGQVLFEIAPLDRVVLEVEIPESEIGLVNQDSAVQLRVDSARMGNVDATLSKIYPMAQLREEKSVFIAPIEVDNESRQYRPGMRGRATVFGPVRPWIWRHIRGFVEQIAWLARW